MMLQGQNTFGRLRNPFVNKRVGTGSCGFRRIKMDFVKITEDILEESEAINKVKSPKCGAVAVFIGTTRDSFEDREVTRLVYEAYESMATKASNQICREIRCNWPAVENIAIFHRLGEVAVGETSVIITVSSPHRVDSLAAVNFGIERLKASVPIWKKEEYRDQQPAEWKQNKEFSLKKQ